MIKAILFDCFGVLTTDKWRAFIDSLPKDADVDRARQLNGQYCAGLITGEQFSAQVYKATGRHPQEVETLLDSEIAKNTALLDYIRELRQRGYKIGLLSNIANNWIRDSFLTPEEQSLFDDMIFSFEVGMTKPDPRIFVLACEHLGVKPEQVVFVDDIERYCAAALEQGLQAIIYTDFKQLRSTLELLLGR